MDRAWRFLLGVLLLPAGLAAQGGERWLKVPTRDFTLLTPLGEKDAVAWAAEFAQFVAALQEFVAVDPRRLPRLTIVVFARERDFEQIRPKRADGSIMNVAGYFSRRPSWAVAATAGRSLSPAARQVLLHEGTHWFLSGFELPNPVWLEEGLAEVFSTFAVEGNRRTWGRPIEDHVRALQRLEPPPLASLLFLPHDTLHTPGEEGELRAGLAYAQSWAFVHYLLFGQREGSKKALGDYVGRLRTTHPDAAFREAFGGTYDEVDRKLREYLRGGRYYVARLPLAELPPPAAEPAPAGEVREALARLRLVGNRHDEARADIAQAVAEAPDDPRGHELEGELALERDELPAARAAFARAVAKGSRDFLPYYQLAAAEHEAATAPAGGMTPARAREIANGYERAINLNPRYRPAYQGLAAVVGATPPGNPEDERFLAHGQRLYPDDGTIRLGLAAYARREGDAAKARTLLDEVLAEPEKLAPEAAAFARRLDAAWLQSDIFARTEALANERKFAEAIAAVDAHVAAGVDIPTRLRLRGLRETLEVSLLMQEAQQAVAGRRWDEARAKLTAVLESKASPLAKAQVRRQLGELERRAPKKAAAP